MTLQPLWLTVLIHVLVAVPATIAAIAAYRHASQASAASTRVEVLVNGTMTALRAELAQALQHIAALQHALTDTRH